MKMPTAQSADEERRNIVEFLRMLAEEVPPEQAAQLDKMKGSVVARMITATAADHIEGRMHDLWRCTEALFDTKKDGGDNGNK